ncbi:acid phosphatase type 7-like [Lytechinus pictus]|uniref:acid phosphatase type 7-like n=1 Tax=Lytechinus pictus TaxID=7653 RepID=UPI0030B9E42D
MGPIHTFKMKPLGSLLIILVIFILVDGRGIDVDTGGGEIHQEDKDSQAEITDDGTGLLKLSQHEQQILHALLGGIGPVILPNDSEPSNLADDKLSPDRDVRQASDDDWPPPIPEQIHIAYGDMPSEMVVMWSTPSIGSSEVVYGNAPENFTLNATGEYQELIDWEGNFDGVKFIHRVKLEGLTSGESYSYRVQTDNEQSQSYTFTAMQQGTDWSPTLLVYGDMGLKGGAPSLRLLNKAARERLADAVIHVGDFAYDLHDEEGKVGDDFMNRIQDIAAVLPYMTCPGNHEIAHDFVHYRYRFSMPRSDWPMGDEMWYSFDMGKAHFVSYSTEIYFAGYPDTQRRQKRWLRKNLEKANEMRGVRPWIIAFGHRPMYCSNLDRDDCTKEDSRVRKGLEDLFYEYGVDLIIEAHEHSYERFWPMHQGVVTAKHYKDPVAPVHVISGAAGCNEFNGVCVNPILGPRGEWSAYRSWIPGLYGFAHLHIANETHLLWQQRLAVSDQVEDEFWIEQSRHGYFPPSTR